MVTSEQGRAGSLQGPLPSTGQEDWHSLEGKVAKG